MVAAPRPRARTGRPQRRRGLLLRGAPRHRRRSLPPRPRQLRGRGLPPRSARPGPAPKEEPRRGSPRPAPPSAEALRKLSARRSLRSETLKSLPRPAGPPPVTGARPLGPPRVPGSPSLCPGCGRGSPSQSGSVRRCRLSLSPVPQHHREHRSRLSAARYLRSQRVAAAPRLVAARCALDKPQSPSPRPVPVPVCQTPFQRETFTSPLPGMRVATYEKRLIFPSVRDNIWCFPYSRGVRR